MQKASDILYSLRLGLVARYANEFVGSGDIILVLINQQELMQLVNALVEYCIVGGVVQNNNSNFLYME